MSSWASARAAVLFVATVPLAVGVAAEPEWIWGPQERAAGQRPRLITTFDVDAPPARAVLRGVADYCEARVFVNGRAVVGRPRYGDPFEVDVTGQVVRGRNEIAFVCRSVAGPAAVFARLTLQGVGDETREVVTDETWRWTPAEPDPESVTMGVASFGPVARHPWGETGGVRIEPQDDYTQWERARGEAATDPATFLVPPGFEIARLRTAREGEGSWVAMTFDPHGRLILAREERGLLRLALDERSGEVAGVETIDESLAECRGLAFVGGDLYAMANNDKGLFRLRDTDGDDRFDEVRRLATFEGDVGHGRNQIAIGPDGRLYAIFGDSVHEPEGARSLVPDLASPSRLEATPSGFVARMDLESLEWEVVVRGLRNPYGLAWNDDGELFTYDADAEYDMGAPWYRPTRIDHLVSGGDFGWRRVTKEWPPYVPDRPDMPRPVFDVGKGSPTSVAWAGRSAFPASYRDALFALDWAYGRILAVHLSPRGSGYAAGAETFLRGRPANVTDVEFGPDGWMYFVTGGRGTQSALYRVRYNGPAEQPKAPTKQQIARAAHAEIARTRRRSLEALHGPDQEDEVATIWSDLGAPDPWIAHAARVALEWQPIDRWRDRALSERSPSRSLAALLALVRVGGDDRHTEIASRLCGLLDERLDTEDLLGAVFVAERIVEGGSLPDAARQQLAAALDRLYPHESLRVNRRLGPLLRSLGAAGLVERTVPLLPPAATQEERLQHLFVLRDATSGWTPALRRTYFDHLRATREYTGGEGMPTFLRLVRESALESVPEGERDEYARLLANDLAEDWRREVPEEPRPTVREWTIADLGPALDDPGERDLDRGRRMFAAARCIVCHRVDGLGGVTGPDLSSVARRFRPRDVLTSVLEPSRVIDEKYRLETFVLADGRVVTGQVVPGGDFRSPTLRVAVDPLAPERFVEFPKAEIELRQESNVSPMPAGLLNGLARDEILDLLAWLDRPRPVE